MTLFLDGNGRRLSRKTPQVSDKSHRLRQLFLFSVLAQKFKLMNAGRRYSFIDISTTPANRPTRAQHNYLLILFEDACKQKCRKVFGIVSADWLDPTLLAAGGPAQNSKMSGGGRARIYRYLDISDELAGRTKATPSSDNGRRRL